MKTMRRDELLHVMNTALNSAIRLPMNSSTLSENFRPLLNSTSIQNPTPTSYLLELTDELTPHLNIPHLSDFELPSTIADSVPTLSFILGRKGSDQACFDGFIFSKDRTRPNGDIYWQCRDRKTYTPFGYLFSIYSFDITVLLILNTCHAIICWVTRIISCVFIN